jgi:hypothetical protein
MPLIFNQVKNNRGNVSRCRIGAKSHLNPAKTIVHQTPPYLVTHSLITLHITTKMSGNVDKPSPNRPVVDVLDDNTNVDNEMEVIFQRLEALRLEENALMKRLNELLIKEKESALQRLQRVDRMQKRLKDESDRASLAVALLFIYVTDM